MVRTASLGALPYGLGLAHTHFLSYNPKSGQRCNKCDDKERFIHGNHLQLEALPKSDPLVELFYSVSRREYRET